MRISAREFVSTSVACAAINDSCATANCDSTRACALACVVVSRDCALLNADSARMTASAASFELLCASPSPFATLFPTLASIETSLPETLANTLTSALGCKCPV